MPTLSFALFDDLRERVSEEITFADKKELPKILNKLWDKFLNGEYNDVSGYFFEKKTKTQDIKYVLDALNKDNFYVANRFEKYYVIAFAINHTRFHIWSKDKEPQLIEWCEPGPIVDNLELDYDVNPVVKLINTINNV